MRRILVLFVLLAMFGCGQPTAESYAKRIRAAQKLPMEQMLKKTTEIGEEASKKLSTEEYSRFIQIVTDASLKDLAEIGVDFSEHTPVDSGNEQTPVKVDVYTIKLQESEQDLFNLQDQKGYADTKAKRDEFDRKIEDVKKKIEELKDSIIAHCSKQELEEMKRKIEDDIRFNKSNITGEVNKTTVKLQEIVDSLSVVLSKVEAHIQNR